LAAAAQSTLKLIFLVVGRTAPKANGRRVKIKFSGGWPHWSKAQWLASQN
jgi:hypothetical protein